MDITYPDTRAEYTIKRTYSRQKEDGTFEDWNDIVERTIQHQTWLWERAQGRPLDDSQKSELEELRALELSFKATLSGRCLWMGGTEISRKRESSLFNCAGTVAETVYDIVDEFWLLL